MGLTTTPVSQCLDKKMKIFGFEIADLFFVFMLLAVLNFFMGSSDQKLLLVWFPPFVLALILKYGKQGKPENYLIHWLKFQFSPGSYSAFNEPTKNPFPPQLKGVSL